VLHLAEEKRNLTRPVAFRVRASASCSCSSSSLPLSARSPIQFTMHAWPALRAFRFKAATLMPVEARSMPRFNLNTRRAQQLAPLVVVALCLREGKRRGAAAPALLGRWRRHLNCSGGRSQPPPCQGIQWRAEPSRGRERTRMERSGSWSKGSLVKTARGM
jgi:hypothetical protein